MQTDDLSAYYSTSTFGTAATFTHGVTVSSIVVIFDRAGAVVTVGEMEVQTAAPVARCKASDVSTAAQGDTFAIGGVTYYALRIEPINNEESLVYLSLTA